MMIRNQRTREDVKILLLVNDRYMLLTAYSMYFCNNDPVDSYYMAKNWHDVEI